MCFFFSQILNKSGNPIVTLLLKKRSEVQPLQQGSTTHASTVFKYTNVLGWHASLVVGKAQAKKQTSFTIEGRKEKILYILKSTVESARAGQTVLRHQQTYVGGRLMLNS